MFKNAIIRYGEQPASEFLAHPHNPRKHPDKQRKLVNASLKRFGWVAPVVVNVTTGYVIDGHERVWQALSAGDDTPVPFVEVQVPTELEAELIAVFDRITYEAEYDPVNLQALMEQVNTDDEVLAKLFAEMKEEYIPLSDEPLPDNPPSMDKAEELKQKWQTERGQLWIIPTKHGEHRLLCGDSTLKADVDRVMGGDKAELCFTSPPYSDMRDYGGNDLSVETLSEFIPASSEWVNFYCVNLGIKREDHEIVPYWDQYINSAKSAGLKLISWNVWYKEGNTGSIAMQSAMFAIEHEWIFVFGRQSKAINRTVEKKTDTLPKFKSKRQKDGSMKVYSAGTNFDKKNLGTVAFGASQQGEIRSYHPAVMGQEVVDQYILAVTDKGQFVYEPFGGSGTTMVACEQTGRLCRMIEIEPKYVAVILERMATLGLEPSLI